MLTEEEKAKAKAYMEEEMKKPLSNYGRPFDLAVDCCSYLELWEDDMSIPFELTDMAKTFFPPLEGEDETYD
jgi:hypothetical protein